MAGKCDSRGESDRQGQSLLGYFYIPTCVVPVRAASARSVYYREREMAGGGVVHGPVGVAKERAQQYKGRVTPFVVMACLVAAVGGSIFGYDIGISGKPFLQILYIINHQLSSSSSLILPVRKQRLLRDNSERKIQIREEKGCERLDLGRDRCGGGGRLRLRPRRLIE